MTSHLITTMILMPLVGAASQLSGKAWTRWVGIGSAVLSSSFCLALIVQMPGAGGLDAAETLRWVESFSIQYSVGVDGLSIASLLLIALLFPIVLIAEWSKEKNVHGKYGLLLLLQSTLFGAVVAQDLFLFVFFWALSTLLFYFLIAVWGGPDRESAAFQFVLNASVGNAFLLAGCILLYYASHPHSFSIEALRNLDATGSFVGFMGMELDLQLLAFTFFCLSLAFRVPIWPLNGWFSSFCREAPGAISVVLAGVFVPVAVMVFARLTYLLFPMELEAYSRVVIIIGAVSVVMGTICAVTQLALRTVLSYISLAGVGFMLMGFGSRSPEAIVGAMFQGLSLGVGLAGFGLFVGLLLSRTSQDSLIDDQGERRFGGMVGKAPMLSLVVAIIFASILGFPGLGGFVGQFLIFTGGFSVHAWVPLVMILGVLVLIYGIFSAFRLVFLGEVANNRGAASFSDLSARERAYFFPLVLVLIFVGIYPKPILDLIRPAVESVLGGSI